MLTIRLAKIGKRNQAFYRVVLTDDRKKITGLAKEVLGHWDGRGKALINESEVEKWVKLGAKKSEAVKKLLEKTS